MKKQYVNTKICQKVWAFLVLSSKRSVPQSPCPIKEQIKIICLHILLHPLYIEWPCYCGFSQVGCLCDTSQTVPIIGEIGCVLQKFRSCPLFVSPYAHKTTVDAKKSKVNIYHLCDSLRGCHYIYFIQRIIYLALPVSSSNKNV